MFSDPVVTTIFIVTLVAGGLGVAALMVSNLVKFFTIEPNAHCFYCGEPLDERGSCECMSKKSQ